MMEGGTNGDNGDFPLHSFDYSTRQEDEVPLYPYTFSDHELDLSLNPVPGPVDGLSSSTYVDSWLSAGVHVS